MNPDEEHFTPIDVLARELHAAVDDYRARSEAIGWPTPVDRAVYVALDAALDLYLAFLDHIEADHPPERPVH